MSLKELKEIFSYYDKIEALQSVRYLGGSRYLLNFTCWGKCGNVEFDLRNKYTVVSVSSPPEETCFSMVVKKL